MATGDETLVGDKTLVGDETLARDNCLVVDWTAALSSRSLDDHLANKKVSRHKKCSHLLPLQQSQHFSLGHFHVAC